MTRLHAVTTTPEHPRELAKKAIVHHREAKSGALTQAKIDGKDSYEERHPLHYRLAVEGSARFSSYGWLRRLKVWLRLI